MQRLCLLSAIKKVEFVDRKNPFQAVIPLTLYLLTTPLILEFFETICLGLVGHQVPAPQFPIYAVDQIYNCSIIWKGSRRCRAQTDAEPLHLPHELEILLIFSYQVPLWIYGRTLSMFSSY